MSNHFTFPPKFCYEANELNENTNRELSPPNKFSVEWHRNFFFFNRSLCSSKCNNDLQLQTRDVPPTITEPSTSAQNSNKTLNGEGAPTMIHSTYFRFITYELSPEEETFLGHVRRRRIR